MDQHGRGPVRGWDGQVLTVRFDDETLAPDSPKGLRVTYVDWQYCP